MKTSRFYPVRTAPVMIAAAAMLALPGCRSAQAIPGQRLAATGAALADFSKRITSHLFENGMMVGVGNDDRCLYIFFTPDIRHRQRPPSRVQLTLWLDANGGKAKKLGLVHICGPEGQKMPHAEGQPETNAEDHAAPGDRPVPEAVGNAPALLKIIDNSQGKEFLLGAGGSQWPSVRLAADWGDFAYQWRIPFQGAGDWPGLSGGPGRVIGIGLFWQIKALAAPENKDAARPPGGPGRGDPGMGPPPGLEERGLPGETTASKRKIWVKTTLVGK